MAIRALNNIIEHGSFEDMKDKFKSFIRIHKECILVDDALIL